MAWVLGVGEIVQPTVRREVVQVGEQAGARIEPVPAREVIQINRRSRSRDKALIPHIDVVQNRAGQVGVVAEQIAVWEPQIVKAVSNGSLPGEKRRMSAARRSHRKRDGYSLRAV